MERAPRFANLRITTADGRILPIRFPFSKGYLPEELELEIQRKYGFIEGCFKLSHNGNILPPTRRENNLLSLGIRDGDTIQLIEFPGEFCNPDAYLRSAAAQGNTEAVKYLIEKYGLDLNRIHKKTVPPLHSSQWHGCKDIVEYLLGCGADPSLEKIKKTKRELSPPMRYSIGRGRYKDLNSMIAAGGNLAAIPKRTKRGSTDEYLLCEVPTWIDFVLESGIDPRQVLFYINKTPEDVESIQSCI